MSNSKAVVPIPSPARDGLLPGKKWRSTNGKLNPRWVHAEAIALGKSFHSHLPKCALDLVKSGAWGKGKVVILEDKLGLKATVTWSGAGT